MSSDDIYKNKQRLPGSKKGSRSQKRRYSRSHRKFDDKRKRRSKNTGLRRLLHLSRKEGNEKVVWYMFLTFAVVLLVIVGVWQYWILELMARKDVDQNPPEENVEQPVIEGSTEEQATQPVH